LLLIRGGIKEGGKEKCVVNHELSDGCRPAGDSILFDALDETGVESAKLVTLSYGPGIEVARATPNLIAL